MTGKANFSCRKGDTFERNVTFRNKTSNTPVNLTGATVSGTVGSIPLVCSLVNASAGTFKFGLSATTTATLSGTSQILVKITYPDASVKTVIAGNFVIEV